MAIKLIELRKILNKYGWGSIGDYIKSSAIEIVDGSLYQLLSAFVLSFQNVGENYELRPSEEFRLYKIFVDINENDLYDIEKRLKQKFEAKFPFQRYSIVRDLKCANLIDLELAEAMFQASITAQYGVFFTEIFRELHILGILNKPVLNFLQNCKLEFTTYVPIVLNGANVMAPKVKHTMGDHKNFFALVLYGMQQNGGLESFLKKKNVEEIIVAIVDNWAGTLRSTNPEKYKQIRCANLESLKEYALKPNFGGKLFDLTVGFAFTPVKEKQNNPRLSCLVKK